jgi:hypothetical protein
MNAAAAAATSAAAEPVASTAGELKCSSSPPPAATPIPTPQSSALADHVKGLGDLIGPCGLRYQHRLDDERGRHDDACKDRPEGERPGRPGQREHHETGAHERQHQSKLPSQG